MTDLFLKIVNMSVSASWLLLAVLVTRFLLKKAPRWISMLLWGIVGIRLICPFSVESVLSLIPSAEIITSDIMLDATPGIYTGVPAINSIVNPVIHQMFAPPTDMVTSMNPLQLWIPLMAVVWVMGVMLMLVYTAVSYLRLNKMVKEAVRLQENVFQCERVASPFVLGVIRPRIYVPYSLDEQQLQHVIAHEYAHIQRKDHWWKPLGFLLLTVYWFNPLCWLGYWLLCRDIELACDEKVIKTLGTEQRADYSQALLSCSIGRRGIAACPLAFGEVDVKMRVKSVLQYKKPAFWLIIVSVVVCILLAVGFLTNPVNSTNEELAVFIDCRIAEQYQSEKTQGHAGCVDWKLLGKERTGRDTTLYMWVLYEEYSLENGQLQQEMGAHTPTAITVRKENGGYRLVEYWTPRDGAYYASDIREKFPWYLYRKGIDSQRYIEQQKENCLEMAKDYFSTSAVLPEFTVPQATESITVPSVPEDTQGLVFTRMIDSIGYDVDGDGKTEMCTLYHGPHSGRYTVILTVTPMEPTASSPIYNCMFEPPALLEGFVVDEHGRVQIKGVSQGEEPAVTYYNIAIVDDELMLLTDSDSFFALEEWPQP